MKAIATVFFAGALVLAATPVSAHHSITPVFDMHTILSFRGTVTRIEWMNPHTYIFMDVKDEATGRLTTWAFEAGSSSELAKQGWTRASIKIGASLVVDGARARDGSKIVHVKHIAQSPRS